MGISDFDLELLDIESKPNCLVLPSPSRDMMYK